MNIQPTQPDHVDTISVKGVIFRRTDNKERETWEVIHPSDANLTFFCVKDYGGAPGVDHPLEAFSGWRVVSGGPFTQAGQWWSRDEALAGAAPWILAYYTRQADELAKAAQRIYDKIGRGPMPYPESRCDVAWVVKDGKAIARGVDYVDGSGRKVPVLEPGEIMVETIGYPNFTIIKK